MRLEESVATAGLGLAVLALVLLVWTALKTAKQHAEWYRQLPEQYPGTMVDVCMLVLWAGILMTQISSILLHAEPGGTYRVVPLMWVGTAAAVFILGLYGGRLMMRLEMRAYRAKREEQAREA